jgi:nucleoside phosphorylase
MKSGVMCSPILTYHIVSNDRFSLPFAVIRTISDRADDDAHIDFPRFINSVARHYSLAIVEAWLQRA